MGKRQILITNDDGIKSDGLRRLVECALLFGEVTVVAPESERSAASHSLTLRHSVDCYPYDFGIEGVRAYTCSGTPSDCVRVGSLYLMPEKPDVVMSGINYGYNVSSDIQYSATLGAAFEGEFQGYHSIAFSESNNGIHEVTDHYLKELMEEMLQREYVPGYVDSINFPGCKLSECKGVLRDRTVSRTPFYTDRYKKTADLENGGVSLMVDGIYSPVHEDDTDYGAVLDNYVSVGVVKNLC